MEDIELLLETATESMQNAVEFTHKAFAKFRAGKANVSMLDGIMVDYYGAATPLSQVAGLSTPDSRTISIKPWEKTIISDIERAIVNSDLGVNPQNNGESIMINIPPLTEERRAQLAKQVKGEAENGKVRVRNVRKDINDELKALKDSVGEDDVKRAEVEVQKLTDTYVAKIDTIYAAKEKEVMTI